MERGWGGSPGEAGKRVSSWRWVPRLHGPPHSAWAHRGLPGGLPGGGGCSWERGGVWSGGEWVCDERPLPPPQLPCDSGESQSLPSLGGGGAGQPGNTEVQQRFVPASLLFTCGLRGRRCGAVGRLDTCKHRDPWPGAVVLWGLGVWLCGAAAGCGRVCVCKRDRGRERKGEGGREVGTDWGASVCAHVCESCWGLPGGSPPLSPTSPSPPPLLIWGPCGRFPISGLCPIRGPIWG